MNQESPPVGDNAGKNAGKKERKRSEVLSLLVFPVIVVVLGAVLVTAFTPLGASLRELLFHTRATVTGSVTVDGKPAVSVQLKLDGMDMGSTDADGRFLLTEVGKGQHRLDLERLDVQPRDEVFSVTSGQSAMQVGNLEMEPLVRLGYALFTQLSATQFSGPQLNYDITLWIIGDPDVLRRVRSVSYVLPPPLPSRPVNGASAGRAFCYRQTGSLSFQGASLGTNSPVLALANVDLGAGQRFQISAPAGATQPPPCTAHQAGPAPSPTQTSAPSQQQATTQGPQPTPSATQPGSSPTSTPTPLILVPNVVSQTAAEATAILQQDGFNVATTSTPAPSDQGVEPGTVYNQNPAAETREPKGRLIQIFVQPQNATATPSPTPP